MSDEQATFLELLLRLGGGTLYYNDVVEGCLIRVTGIRHGLKLDPSDPDEVPESGAYLANTTKYVGLLGACPEDFRFMVEVPVQFPE